MEILRDNLEESLPLIKESILSCDFYSIDLEFSGKLEFFCQILNGSSGIESTIDEKALEFDKLDERYQKVKAAVEKFIAFQVGITTFHWKETEKKYKARPFSFYIFHKSQTTDKCMLISVSCPNSLNKLSGSCNQFPCRQQLRL
jgi:hypothetical protein